MHSARARDTRHAGRRSCVPWRVPKIFFGTRTHKQIYQIVKELRRTSYRNARTVVLSSREHTCIHPTVSRSRNKNEGCRELLDPQRGEGCRFNHGVARIKRHEQLAQFGLDAAWDIEDLVRLGKKIKACPYFAARSLVDTAEIVFCPYNYLVDPLIREAMSINLTEQVIILDEAHNIEDSAREAASCTLTQDAILEARDDLEKLAALKVDEEECTKLASMLSALSGWVDQNSDKLTDYTEFDRSGKIFTGTQMIASLDMLGIGNDKIGELKRCFNVVTDDQDPEDLNPRISSNTSMLLKSLFLMYEFLYMDNMKYRDDYRIAIVKSQTRKRAPNASGWLGKRATISWAFSINFWCLNPGVAFSSVGANVRCIILTSGTLSPMSSFQSELGVPFKIQLEANHVIDKNQVWVGTVGKGPTDQMLQATYRHTETWGFQDELGKLVLDVCRSVPRGVLCFLPSYSLLNKLLDRWQITGLWDELNKVKISMCEPRSGEEFEETMKLFYDTIRRTGEECDGEVNGAFFMAVCRGKVSEGLDFTDDNARAVIAVGIPFPNVKDIQVDLKRQYNNAHCRTRGLLSGGDWYEIQAYRAVNQALGRCLRHRYDWGALILVDERYQRGSLSSGVQQNKYTKGLSKWVRNKIVHHPSYAMALSSLNQFARNMTANPPKKPESMNETQTATVEKDAVCGNSSKFQTAKMLLDSENSSSTTAGALSMLVDGLGSTQNTTVAHDASVKNETGIILPSQFSSTIVGGCNERDLDDDFCSSPSSLVIPPSRFLFTSTQISDSKSSSVLPSKSSNKNDFTSALTLHTSSKETSIGKVSQVPRSPDDSVDNPPKRRKSFFLTNSEASNSHAQKDEGPKLESSSAADQEVYEFQYIDPKSKVHVSPLKELLETEIRSRANSSPVQCNSRKEEPQSKKNLGQEFINGESKTGTSSSSHDRSSSPQMFDSDEDLFADATPKKNKQKGGKDEKSTVSGLKPSNVRLAPIFGSHLAYQKKKVTPPKEKEPKSVEKSQKSEGKSKGCGKVNCGKENSECCKVPRKRPLMSQNVPSQVPPTVGAESDLDDFDLNQSYNSPAGGERVVRRVSRGRRSLSRRKGVQYSDAEDL
ncbi:Fanconi anemia group J protein homolog isoform X2 [Penaeus vannamei]|uniref:Fanconi anemia group J protein homolog isoform X2 n=1 Tax=Penaeus vannamei TaxID=6689 RepID=UPI00387F8897